MMNRKWTVLAVTMASVALLATGLSMAQDEASPLAQIMEKVNATSAKITKAVRTPVSYKKSQKDVVTDAQELAKLGAQAREIKDAAKAAKDVPDAETQWNGLMDKMIAASRELATVAGKADQTAAKKANQVVKNACAECHKVFRIEEDDF
jgi:cytochrome c556